MKRSWLITIAACILLTGMGVAVVTVPRVIPRAKCSAVYQRYVDVDGVDAAFLKDYQVNDTVTVDVTLLKAIDSIGWATLRRDFQISTPEEMSFPYSKTGYVTLKYAPHDNNKTRMDSVLSDNDLMAISYKDMTVAFFDIESEKQENAIIMLQFTNLKKEKEK